MCPLMPINKTKQNKTSRRFRSKYRRSSVFRRIAFVVLLTFTSCEIFPASVISSKVYAQTILNLPVPGTMVTTTLPFSPPVIRGLTIHPENPLRFDFIMDQGETQLKGDELKKEYEKLIKYFLATLAIPEDDLWVNLSPYEKERIIPNEFGLTEMGRDLLAQDYILKQLMASLTYPESGLGKKFWDEIYKKAYEQYGTTNIPLNTFNKVWIVPDKAVVYQNKDKAFIVESHLKVMLEEDYLALAKNMKNEKLGTTKQKEEDVKAINNVSSLIAKEILIPAIEKEVNENKNFAQLRQIYNSMILAVWYKKALKDKLLNKVYSNQKKIKGVDADDPEIKEKIYQQYIKAFKMGVYSMIKEDNDPYMQKTIPRKYFSGGFDGPALKKVEETKYELSMSDMASLTEGEQKHGWDIVPTGVVPPEMAPNIETKSQVLQSGVSRRRFLGMLSGLLPTIGLFPSLLRAQNDTFLLDLEQKDNDLIHSWTGFDTTHFRTLPQREGIEYLEKFSQEIRAGRISKDEAAELLRKLFSESYFLWVRLKVLEIMARHQILTVDEIMALRNSPESQIIDKVPELLGLHGTKEARSKLLEMKHKAYSYPHEERVAIIRAIAQWGDEEAEKILLDWIDQGTSMLPVLVEEIGHIHTAKVEEKLFSSPHWAIARI